MSPRPQAPKICRCNRLLLKSLQSLKSMRKNTKRRRCVLALLAPQSIFSNFVSPLLCHTFDYTPQNELKDMTPGQIWFKALYTLFAGLGIVGVFSDPMCDVLSAMTNPDYTGDLGSHIPINPFFVSFIVTPICSNASELISSLAFAAKKTKKSISMTYVSAMHALSHRLFCVFAVVCT